MTTIVPDRGLPIRGWPERSLPLAGEGLLIRVTDPPSGHAALFAVGDVLRIKAFNGTAILDNWLQVQSVNDPGAGAGYYEYTVTRLSGTPGTFPEGAAIVNYGQSGDGMIRMTSDDADGPFIEIGKHGGTPWQPSHATTGIFQQVVIGKLDRVAAVTGTEWGFAAGTDLRDAANPYVIISDQQVTLSEVDLTITDGDFTLKSAASGTRIEVTNAHLAGYNGTTLQFELRASDGKAYAGGGAVVLDNDGVTLDAATSYGAGKWIRFVEGTTELGYVEHAYLSGLGINVLRLGTEAVLGSDWVSLEADQVIVSGAPDTVHAPTETEPFIVNGAARFKGDGVFTGDLRPVRGGTIYTAYTFVPLTTPLTSTSWDGDSKSATSGAQTLDLASVFGVPSNARAVLLSLDGTAAAAGNRIAFTPQNNRSYGPLQCRVQDANDYYPQLAVMPCASGSATIYWWTSGTMSEVYLQVWGYFV